MKRTNMVIKEIEQFSDARYQIRAYMCYLFSRNVPNGLPDANLNMITKGLKKIADDIKDFEALYVLDNKGIQIVDNITNKKEFIAGKSENRSNKAYYYRAVREKRCILTDPYPSSLTNDLCVTASIPIYDDEKNLRYVVCMDVSLTSVLKMAHPSAFDSIFGKIVKTVYTAFSIALFIVALFLFMHGMKGFIVNGFSIHEIDIKEMFESTIVLTLSLAIFDLVKTIFEEEVLGISRKNRDTVGVHKTMVRFVGSIIIALAIEALMLVFKFAIIGPENIIYAVYLILGVTALIIGLSIYLWAIKTRGYNDSNY